MNKSDGMLVVSAVILVLRFVDTASARTLSCYRKRREE